MQRKARIKDIAEMAGVSSGTVDRILHNRGNVSESARKAVEEVLKKVNYKPNIHISGLSLKRKYKVVITTYTKCYRGRVLGQHSFGDSACT